VDNTDGALARRIFRGRAATMSRLRGDELSRLSVKRTLVIKAASAVPGYAGSRRAPM